MEIQTYPTTKKGIRSRFNRFLLVYFNAMSDLWNTWRFPKMGYPKLYRPFSWNPWLYWGSPILHDFTEIPYLTITHILHGAGKYSSTMEHIGYETYPSLMKPSSVSHGSQSLSYLMTHIGYIMYGSLYIYIWGFP